MYFERFFVRDLAQASYLIGCQQTGEALVVDPRRDTDIYIETARREGLRITQVTETHIHADFQSGARELSEETGAQLLLSDEGGADWHYRFAHHGLHGGDSFMVGNVRIDVLHTPGHTPEHLTFLITDTPAGDVPTMALTGDFVFVGAVGRPDLLEKAARVSGTQEAGARELYHSLLRLQEQPDHLTLWPGHGAGSACGKALGAVPSTTLGYERKTSPAFKAETEDDFVSQVLDGQPEPPSYFGRMKVENRKGPALLHGLPRPAELSVDQLATAAAEGVQLVDARSRQEFSVGHVAGSLNIQADEGFSTWAGWTLDSTRPVVLIAPEYRIEELVRGLVRVGIDQVTGYFGDVQAWLDAGKELRELPQVTPEELNGRRSDVTVVDVRSRDEWDEGHISGALHVHVGELRDRLGEIPTGHPLVLHCESGDRSTLGASILESMGVESVANLNGGIAAWKQDALPVTA